VINKFRIENNVEAKIADHNPSIVKFGVKNAAKDNTTPLTTREKIPKVAIVIGSDRICRTGLINVFNIAKINPPTSAEPIPLIDTLSIKIEITYNIIAYISALENSPFSLITLILHF